MTDALQILREFGFQTLVCLWFMWRLEREMKNTQTALTKMASAVRALAGQFEEEEVE